jgi:lipid II:glycine glycyltransferase (peptidoglycan interpeptide bridge formation enzyme)
MLTIEENLEPDEDWNNRLLKSEIGPMVQTTQMSLTYKSQGGSPRFLKFVDSNENILGQLMLGVLPRFTNSPRRKILNKFPGIKKSTYYWTQGPIIFESEYAQDIFKSLQNYLLSKKSRVYGTTFPLCDFNKNFISKNFEIQEWATSLIDLRKPIEELYSNISKHSGQKNIKRAEKRGVTIEEIDENNLLDYHCIKQDFRDRMNEDTVDYQYTLDWWRRVKPIGYSGFLARKEGKAISGILFSYFNKIIVEAGIARSLEDVKEKLYSQDLIKWKMIEWGKNNKMNYYNLAGYNPYPKTPKEEGIKRYKEKWGGEKFSYWYIKK